jgi:hypothetical protein
MLRMRETRDLKLPGGRVDVLREVRDGEDLVVTLRSDVFLHGVHVREDLRLSDNYFDLFPGHEKVVRIEGTRESPAWRTVL